MAKVFVVHEENEDVKVEVFSVPEDEPGGADGSWDGACNQPGCKDWTISDGQTRFNDDAVMEAIIHIDNKH